MDINFKEWILLIERGSTTAGKTGLYPIQYGAGQYCPLYFMPKSADVLYYMSKDDRFYLGKEGHPFDITHIPGKPSHKGPTPGEGPPWSIRNVPKKNTGN